MLWVYVKTTPRSLLSLDKDSLPSCENKKDRKITETTEEAIPDSQNHCYLCTSLAMFFFFFFHLDREMLTLQIRIDEIKTTLFFWGVCTVDFFLVYSEYLLSADDLPRI